MIGPFRSTRLGCLFALSTLLLIQLELSECCDGREGEGSAKPNILFIAIDDLRCDLGCYGVNHVKTPNFDAFAKTAVQFNRAYVAQAVCNPSRVSLMTGLRPDRTKVWDLVTDFRTTIPDAVTIPQHFRSNGYRAEAFGKIFHNTFPDDISWDSKTFKPTGFAAYSKESREKLAAVKAQMKENGRPQQAITRLRGPATEAQLVEDEQTNDGMMLAAATETLKEMSQGDKPFFLAVGFIRPHLPFISPKKYWELYDRTQIPLAENRFLPEGAPEVAFGDRSHGGLYELRDYMDFRAAPSPFVKSLTDEQQRELRHGYYAAVSFVDAQIGKLLSELEATGKADNTIVVIWSDHGWKLGEHNGWCKQTNYEIDTRSPLFVRLPNSDQNGKATNAFIETVDIYPTLCDLCGIAAPQGLDGKSFSTVLNNVETSSKDFAISQFPRKHAGGEFMGYAIRVSDFRYIEWQDRNTLEIVARELYDHRSDPQENKNIAGNLENSATIASLHEKLWQTIPVPTKLEPEKK